MSIDLSRRSLHPFLLFFLALGGSAACMDAADHAELGTISASLVAQTQSGAIYRLRDGTIQVDGPGSSIVWNTEDDPDRTVLSTDAPAGEYSASLEPGWRLERVFENSATTVAAALASVNPVEFDVLPGQRTDVSLRFQVGSDVVDMASGYEITLDVEELPVSELFVADFLGGVRVYSVTAEGNVAPVRTIEGSATGFALPRAVSIVGDELMVLPHNVRSVLFFPASASGNVAPSRQVNLAGQGLIVDATVFNGELYVLDQASDGRGIRVFPFPSPGDRPTRSLILSSIGSMAIDGGELYVTTATGGRVYPIPPAGSTVFPAFTRTFASSDSPFGEVTFHGEEVFLAVNGRIEVYPRAGGSVPLRTITGTTPTGSPFAGTTAVAGNALFVAGSDSIMVYRADASGVVPPVRTIEGSATGFVGIRDIALH